MVFTFRVILCFVILFILRCNIFAGEAVPSSEIITMNLNDSTAHGFLLLVAMELHQGNPWALVQKISVGNAQEIVDRFDYLWEMERICRRTRDLSLTSFHYEVRDSSVVVAYMEFGYLIRLKIHIIERNKCWWIATIVENPGEFHFALPDEFVEKLGWK